MDLPLTTLSSLNVPNTSWPSQDPMAELRGILEVMPAPARSLVPGGEAEYRGQAHVLMVTAVWPDGI